MPTNVGLGNLVENKDELISHNFDIFNHGSVEKAMEGGYEQEIYPTTSLTSDGPFEFKIEPCSDYILLPHTRLYIKGKIVVPGGGDPAVGTEYSVVNLFPHALFRQVDVHIGNMNTSSQDNLYPYKAFFETLFSYSDTAKKSHLGACSGWADDTIEQMDTIGDENLGYRDRKHVVARTRTFDYCIPLHCDIFQCSKLIPPNTPIKICLSRMPDAFSLMCANGANLEIKLSHLSLFIRKIIPTEHINNLYSVNLSKKPVILPFSRSVIKRETIAAGTTNVHLSLFNGDLPRQILISMVSSNRFDGRKNLNPFKFDHFDTRYVNLRVNGLSVPGRPYEPDFENGIFCRELRALYDNTGILTGDSSYQITREAFLGGRTFFAWDLTPDHCNGFHIHEKKIGKTVDLDLAFRAGLLAPMNVLIYATYETEIKLLDGQCIEANFING